MKSIVFIAIAIASVTAFNANCSGEESVYATLGAYPDQLNVPVNITGMVRICQDNATNHTSMNLMGVTGFTDVCNCTGDACDNTTNSCGIHVHVGDNCNNGSSVGGHFYGANITKDPWTGANGAFYNNENSSTVLDKTYTLMADVGANVSAMAGHTFVVHSNNGSRIGCGVLMMDTQSAGSLFVSMMVMAFIAVFGFFY